jgi:hypothetical protein
VLNFTSEPQSIPLGAAPHRNLLEQRDEHGTLELPAFGATVLQRAMLQRPRARATSLG